VLLILHVSVYGNVSNCTCGRTTFYSKIPTESSWQYSSVPEIPTGQNVAPVWSCNISVWTYFHWSYICSCFVIQHLCIFTHLFYFWYLNSCHMLFNLFNLKIYEWNIFAAVKASDQLPSRLLMYVFWSLRHPFGFYGPSGHLSCPMWVNIWSFNKTWCYCSSLSLFHWPEVVGAAAQHYICLSGYNTSVVKTSQLGSLSQTFIDIMSVQIALYSS